MFIVVDQKTSVYHDVDCDKKYKWYVVVNGVVTFWLIFTSDYKTISHHTNNAYNYEQDFEGICIRKELEK